MNNKGFTLLELIIVIIVLGVLSTLGFSQYSRVVERGRTAEAKALLGQLRTAERAYFLENGSYTNTLANLSMEIPSACASTHYFVYASDTAGVGTATRCVAISKTPNVAPGAVYSITLDYATGAFSGTQGYY